MRFPYVHNLLKIKIFLSRRLNLKIYEHSFRHSHLENVDFPPNYHFINIFLIISSICSVFNHAKMLGMKVRLCTNRSRGKILKTWVSLGGSWDLSFHKMASFAWRQIWIPLDFECCPMNISEGYFFFNLRIETCPFHAPMPTAVKRYVKKHTKKPNPKH